ncbi:D-2-hydroxyacid dehydrogenase [Vibrio hippocampi]|uniref:Glyoxylate/hydroxypyruvate reductase A n=1 Tax=Vibrio hippocampi TaxID=654686 RepID=A0ABM8ZK28_9VIBR|nr:D-2-hydroxyacid dehydrogenase [Vibrio hippocampi]CAH0527289.1 Glyoxylate/hydroxypyruvate reductase A [Vibrio hippocampi]
MTVSSHRLALVTEDNERYLALLNNLQLPELEVVDNLADATIVLAAPPQLVPSLDHASQLEWVQSTYAGVDALLNEALRKDYKLTNVKGMFGPLISEYVLGYAISHYRHFNLYHSQQRNQDWQPHPYQSLSGKLIVIFGTGAIGNSLANSVKALGLVPIGVNRTGIPPKQSAFEATYHVHEAKLALSKADIVVNTLPNTPETVGLFDKPLFEACHRVLFFNVGRGHAVDSGALLSALEAGNVEHAFLDVFIDEPISQECPYWHNPQVTVTPHIAAISLPEQVIEVFAENYQRWIDGYQLKFLIDFEKGY